MEKLGILGASAKDPEIIIKRSLAMTVNLMNVFKSSDSNPRDFIKATQSGLILLALKKRLKMVISRFLILTCIQ